MPALYGNGRHALADALDICTAELEMLIGRIGRNDPVLVLERESGMWWTVTDVANDDLVMMRADRELCIRFMRRFLVVHPEATTDRSAIDHSWKVAQEITENEWINDVALPSNVVPIKASA